MGEKHSKLKRLNTKKEVRKRKGKAKLLRQTTTIYLTNEVLISNNNADPLSDYVKISAIGQGSYSSVYRVKNKYTDSIRAMKIIIKSFVISEEDEEEIWNEVSVLRTLDHPNILKIFEFYSYKDTYSIVTELCSGGQLYHEIIDKGPFDETYSAYVIYQILSAINYCHSMKVIHRDLKPENILIIDRDRYNYPIIKVCDFGTSLMFEKGVVNEKLVGSAYYIAPEVLKKKFDQKCDIWSCGIILYILLSSTPPFN